MRSTGNGPGRALLGLDVSDSKIGVARSDASWQIASPVAVLDRRVIVSDTEMLERLEGLMERYDARNGFVVGLPLRLDRTLGPEARRVESYCASLLRKHPYTFWDESFTTRMAWDATHNVLNSRNLPKDASNKTSRRRRRRRRRPDDEDEELDAIAASIMLQTFLDAHFG